MPWLNHPGGAGRMAFPKISPLNHRIGLWEKLQESPIFDGKNHGD